MDCTPKRKRAVKKVVNKLLEIYPHDLQMYKKPPIGQVSLIEFQDFALERQKILQLVENVSAQPDLKTPEEYRDALKNALKKEGYPAFEKLINKKGCSTHTDADLEARRKDHISHFILRLSYCQKEDLQGYMVTQETELFKWRFSALDTEGFKKFLSINGFDYSPISQEEKGKYREELYSSSLKDTSVDFVDFYKLPFEDVVDLVCDRKVFVHKGEAYVPQSELVSVFVTHFRQHLIAELKTAQAFVLRNLNDDRLQNFLKVLPGCFEGMNRIVWNSESTPIDKLDDLSKISYPLCMRTLHDVFREQHHLKNGGRQQYGLFLKGIGVTLDDALQFWKTEMTKIRTEDDFYKRYAYQIRHNFGKEGRMLNYTPMGCTKIITTAVGAGDHHGCPYRHMDSDLLKKKLSACKISPPDVADIAQLAKGGHYNIACQKYFEVLHQQKPEKAILHPNAYFMESRAIYNKEAIKEEEQANDILADTSMNMTQNGSTQIENTQVSYSEVCTPVRNVKVKKEIKSVERKSIIKAPVNIEALLNEDDYDDDF